MPYPSEAANRHFFIATTSSSRSFTFHFHAVNGHLIWCEGHIVLNQVFLGQTTGLLVSKGSVSTSYVIPGRYIDSNGISRICGDSDLKASQHYPRRFGCAVAECFLDHYEEVRQHVSETRKELQRAPRKEAKDCRFKTNMGYGNFKASFSVYRFIGLSGDFIGLSVYRFIG